MSKNSSTESINIPLAIGFTILSILMFGMQDVTAKVLVQTYPVAQVVMMRFWAFGLFAIFLALRHFGVSFAGAGQALHSNMGKVQALRGIVLLADILLFATGLRTLPLGEAAAITLTFPIFVTVFAIPLLGEKVGPFRWLSVIVGFVGVLIVLRPGFAVLDIGAIFILVATMLFALYIVLTRVVAQKDSTATNMLYVGVIGMVCSSAAGVFFWQMPDLGAWGIALLLMASTTGANYFVMRAMAHAPASVVQPFNYLLLPWAITLSFIVFGQVIDFISLIGAIVIVSSGLMVWLRERGKAG